ncbi:hypothetical protein RB653_008692 [Dictyostelium firmibasis]|uniref:Uncharacterized protein n=1 Tax=Dictyostelium firmibasis TaxID=79012 RepID=A0AAN7U541_9MYCE
MDPLDEIIEKIRLKGENSGVVLRDPKLPGPKTSELSKEQKIMVIDRILEVGLDNITALDLSEKLNIPLKKAETYIKNSKRMERTNNLKTIDLSIKILLKCPTPLYISIDGNFKPISDFSTDQVLKWFSNNNPIQITTNHSMIISPDIQTANNFDVSLAIQTPHNSSFFIVLVGENYFFDSNRITVPFSSPLIISRDSTNYTPGIQDIQNNDIIIKKYGQPLVKSWEEKNIDISFKDSSIQTQNSEPFLDISFSLPSSGFGEMVLKDLNINRDGFVYKLDTFTISVSKKDPIYHIPIRHIDKLNIVQEFASRSTTLNISPGDPVSSSREELYGDILNIKSGFLVCLEHPAMFTDFVYSDIQTLENSGYWSFYFRKMDNINDLVEYIWDKNITLWQKVPLLNRGFGCQFQAIRNQFCPYCVNVFHRLSKTNHVYNIFQSTNTSYIIDFGLDLSINFYNKTNRFYYKNENEKHLGNNLLSIGLNLSKEYADDINNNYFLVPIEKEKESTLFIWLKEIVNGCNGLNITYSDFYNQASCQLPQYSCSNVHYFRDTQDQTQKINEKLNYLFGNSRSSINYLNKELLSIERLQKKLDLNISIYLTSLPILQPFINQTSFTVNQNDSFLIVINFSFINNGSLSGDYSVNINCNDTINSLYNSGEIEMNNIKEFNLKIPKIKTKSIKYYECNSNVLINNQPYWSNFGKEIKSKIYFQVIPKQVEDQCNLKLSKDSLILSKRKEEYLLNEKVIFFFSIENNIESIDWFKVIMNCLGNSDSFSSLFQISTNSSKSFQIIMNSNKLNPKCIISIQSYQIDCNYNILNNTINYSNIFKFQNQTNSLSSSSSPSSSSSSLLSSHSNVLIYLIFIYLLF